MKLFRTVSALVGLALAALLGGCASLADLEGVEALRPGDISRGSSSSAEEPAETQPASDQQQSEPNGDTEETQTASLAAAPESTPELISSLPAPSGIDTLPTGWDALPSGKVEPRAVVAFPPPLWLNVIAAESYGDTLVVVYETDARDATRDLDLDGSADVPAPSASSSGSFIVASYDEARRVSWALPLAITSLSDLFIDPRNGDLYLQGVWSGANDIDFDQNGRPELTAYRDEPDGDDRTWFLARLRRDGTAVWARPLHGFEPGRLHAGESNSVRAIAWVPGLPEYDYARGAADVDGDGAVDLEGGQFLLSIARDGDLSIAETYDRLQVSWISAYFSGADGTRTMVGLLDRPVDLDGDGELDTRGPGADSGRRDVFVARLGRNGSLVWANSFASGPRSSVVEVASAPDGSFYVSGRYSGEGNTGPDFNADGRSDFPPAAVFGDAGFIARFRADGTFDWSVPIAAPELTVTSDGGLLIPVGPPADLPASRNSDRPPYGIPAVPVEGRGVVYGPETGVVTSLAPSGEIRWVRTVNGDNVHGRAVFAAGDRLTIVGTYGIIADFNGDGEFEAKPAEPMGGADFKSGPYTPFILEVDAP